MKGGEGIRLTNVLSQEAGRRDVGGGGLRELHGPPFVCLSTLKGLKRKFNVFLAIKM